MLMRIYILHLHFIYMYMQFLLMSFTLFLLGKTGQNKNKYVIGYLLWRVMIGLHRAIDLHMQIPGHTKCQVDAGFAQIKKKYRR